MSLFQNKFKKWSEENNLSCEEKLKLGFLRSENVAIKNIIWGEYDDKRLFFFEIINSTGQRSQSYFYLNRNFYSKIKADDIRDILEGVLQPEKMKEVFGGETNIEIVQIIIAQIYLDSKEKFEYNKVKKVFKSLQKFYNSKVNLKDKFVGSLVRGIRSDIKYNSEEAIDSACKNSGEEKELVKKVADTYENLLDEFNKN